MLQALLFDLDGTLANTDPIHFQTWQDILRDYGLEFDHAFYQTHFSGRLNAAIVKDLLPHLSLEAGKQLGDDKEAEYRKRAAKELKPLAGLLELLEWANQKQLKQAVVTNAPKDNAQFMLHVLGLNKHFATVVLAEELEKGKPDPMPYQVGLELLDVSPVSAVAFEDSLTGVRSAVGAGILTIGVATTHEPEALMASGAKLVVNDLTDPKLEALLLGFGQEINAMAL
ncbi:MAG: HAD-IA family hydrolase [Coleofasciculus sp. C1-SOL-03]|jgi:HAD superfamily hydrolase (TIGR01509 family)|uniref:HAD family hydrolase n=1 Tax=Coleofasciculus sp. C1-SOL-03 TaxID=3069522 RepID=UPI0033000B11